MLDSAQKGTQENVTSFVLMATASLEVIVNLTMETKLLMLLMQR